MFNSYSAIISFIITIILIIVTVIIFIIKFIIVFVINPIFFIIDEMIRIKQIYLKKYDFLLFLIFLIDQFPYQSMLNSEINLFNLENIFVV